MSMVTTWKSGVYHLLPTCHIQINVTLELLDLERLFCDFRLQPRCKRDFPSSGMLRRVAG